MRRLTAVLASFVLVVVVWPQPDTDARRVAELRRSLAATEAEVDAAAAAHGWGSAAVRRVAGNAAPLYGELRVIYQRRPDLDKRP